MTPSHPNRRDLILALSGTGLLAAMPLKAAAQVKARLVIVGGGFGGATAARFLKTLLPDASVTLIEANAEYYACPFSNLVVTGLRELSAQSFSYEALKAQGIKFVHNRAVEVDPVGRSVQVSSGQTFAYDKLILSPGIDFRWNDIDGYDEAAAEIMPHAWKAGAQTHITPPAIERYGGRRRRSHVGPASALPLSTWPIRARQPDRAVSQDT